MNAATASHVEAAQRTPGRLDHRADLARSLAVLAEPPGPQHAHLADLLGVPSPQGRDWTDAFVVQLVPYASVYLSADGMLGGEAADRVAGFWRALRLPVPTEPDHLVALLGLYATLLEAEQDEPDVARAAMWRQAHTALLHEHLLSWLPQYALAMADVAPEPYAAWAGLLRDFLMDQAAARPPDRLPLHLRDLPDPESGADVDRFDAALDLLLAPARSGVIVTRAHVARAARQRSVGIRLGDRRRMLRSLIEQDPAGSLAALAEQARTWAQRHTADRAWLGRIAEHWGGRADATAELLHAGAVHLGQTDVSVLDIEGGTRA